MRITKLHIENFRGFRGTHEIEFSDSNVHVIVGVNGAGKTSILDGLAIVLYDISNRISGDINIEEYTITIDRIANENINIHSKESSLVCSLEKHGKVRTKYIIRENDIEVKIETLDRFKEEVFSETLPVLIYYNSGRNFHIDYKYDDSMWVTHGPNGYEDIFEKNTNFSGLFLWYLKQVLSESNPQEMKKLDPNHQASDVSFITNAINKFINKLRDTSLANIEVKISQYNQPILAINKLDEQIEFNQLSSGEKMVIGMVLDIAYRMSIANPQLENPLISEGIVLIDELEQHLHPKWQMSILKALTATFPNVQFIVTTHSPLVINQLKNNELSILDNFKIIPGKEVHKVYGRDVNAIIEDFMGASDRPLNVKTLMNDVEKLLDADHPNIERARKKLNELKAIIDPNDYEVIKLETQIVMEEEDEAY